jgi:predicted ATPase/transcriptional regulator with XRE-family HTH domain
MGELTTEAETYSFGEWLKRRRKQLRLTQRELAANAYCSVVMIKKIEADERRPSPELAELLATALKIPQPDRHLFIKVARGERPVDVLWRLPVPDVTLSLPFHAPASLPSPATPFVGRTDELTQIGERLTDPDCRLLTLIGPGGIGKTRLALAAARSQQATLVEGAAFVSLAAMTDATLIPDAVARSLGLTLTEPPAEQVLAYLRRRSMLLLLDNCEQLNGDLSWLSELMTRASGVKLLATSRERLHLKEEWVYVVPGLVQAVDLFAQTAQRVKLNFDAQAEKTSILRICRLVENLPLAVELAAGWTPLMPCASIADHIQRDMSILAADVRNVPDRHRSIQAVFDHSWNLLSSAEQDGLMRLAVFREGWRAQEALPVAGADLFLLRRLVDKSMVRAGEDGRYDLHDLVRQYASQKLAQSGHEAETRQRHFDAYLALAAHLDAQQFRPQGMEALARFDLEQDNIRAALEWSLDNAPSEQSLTLLYHLGFYWARRGYWQEGGHWAMRAIHQAGERESPHLCLALCYATFFTFVQGRFGEAEPLSLRAMAMARRLEDPEALIRALAMSTFASTDAEQALTSVYKGIELIEETTAAPPYELPQYYLLAGIWLQSSGRYPEAEEAYRKCLALYRQAGAVDLIPDPLGHLGTLTLQQGRLQEAYDLTVESMAAARVAGRYESSGGWRAQLGLIELYLGKVDAAQDSLEEALLMLDDSRYAVEKQETLLIMSQVMLTRSDVTAAAEYLETSLAMCRSLFRQLQATQKLEGAPDALPVNLVGLCACAALVAAAQGEYARAVTLYSIAVSVHSKGGRSVPPPLQAQLDETMTTMRARLADRAYRTAWRMGQVMSLAEGLSFALAENGAQALPFDDTPFP